MQNLAVSRGPDCDFVTQIKAESACVDGEKIQGLTVGVFPSLVGGVGWEGASAAANLESGRGAGREGTALPHFTTIIVSNLRHDNNKLDGCCIWGKLNM